MKQSKEIMRKRYAQEMDRRATDLLRKLDLFEVSVNVQAVAERLGANVVFDDLEDEVSGFLLKEKGVVTIAINKAHHPNRQRFTIAHECGHLALHATGQKDQLWVDKAYLFFRDSQSSTGDQLAEIQANQFAAGLLMPEELIRARLASRTGHFMNPRLLHSQFQALEPPEDALRLPVQIHNYATNPHLL